jgi:hypothetical protein
VGGLVVVAGIYWLYRVERPPFFDHQPEETPRSEPGD